MSTDDAILHSNGIKICLYAKGMLEILLFKKHLKFLSVQTFHYALK